MSNKEYGEKDLLNKNELANFLGVSRQYITNLSRENKLFFVDGEKKNQIYLYKARQQLQNCMDINRVNKVNANPKILEFVFNIKEENKEDFNTAVKKQKQSESNSILLLDIKDFVNEIETLDYNQAKTKNEHINLFQSKIKLEERLGNLVEYKIVQKQAIEYSKKIRNSFEALPKKISARLHAAKNATEVSEILRAEISSILNNLIENGLEKEFDDDNKKYEDNEE